MYNQKLVYDVGIHNGDDTAYYLSRGYNVIAIEADPVQVGKVGEKFKSFISEGRLKILNIGIAPEEGEFDFYINEVYPEWNSFDRSIASRDGLPWHSIKIKTETFDSVIKENGVPYYLKADIEGNDYLCIQGLDKSNLPKFISVEGNYVGLLNELAEKGYKKFKLILQYNFAHLDLPPNKFFRRWLFAYKLRKWNSFPLKVFRKLGGTNFIKWIDGMAVPLYSKQHLKGSSGNFGEKLGGEWHDVEKAVSIYNYYNDLFQKLPDKRDYNFWVDIHATW